MGLVLCGPGLCIQNESARIQFAEKFHSWRKLCHHVNYKLKLKNACVRTQNKKCLSKTSISYKSNLWQKYSDFDPLPIFALIITCIESNNKKSSEK